MTNDNIYNTINPLDKEVLVPLIKIAIMAIENMGDQEFETQYLHYCVNKASDDKGPLGMVAYVTLISTIRAKCDRVATIRELAKRHDAIEAGKTPDQFWKEEDNRPAKEH